MNSTLFKWCRQFYLLFPQIGATVSHEFITQPELLIQPSEDNRNTSMLTIKDPFTFEFLGLDEKEATSSTITNDYYLRFKKVAYLKTDERRIKNV